MMVWFFAEQQSSIFIEFFNSIGTQRPLILDPPASVLTPPGVLEADGNALTLLRNTCGRVKLSSIK
jgi:hypothetical protein